MIDKKYTKIGGMKKDNCRHLKSYKTLGANIRYYRNLLNLSQEELAFRIGTARNYIGCIERGEKFPSLAIIFDIAIALKCKITDLFKNV